MESKLTYGTDSLKSPHSPFSLSSLSIVDLSMPLAADGFLAVANFP